MWTMFVNGIVALLGHLAAGLDGSYGLAVIALALAVRLALLPMTLHAAEQGWLRQRRLATLKPQLERLREHHAKNPAAHAAAMQSLYREHGITSGLGSGLLTALVQAPMSAGIYAAIRQGMTSMGSFLWIPKLARPDLWLALSVAMLGMAAMLLNPMLPEQARTLLHWLPVAISFFMVWHVAAGLGLYWLGSGSVTVLQNLLLRQRVRRLPA
ncbi:MULTISPECIES: membrane protein insertase YidC [Rhodanobacter]|uniref:Membrane protein insertase YidC n=1 Tax=Rhodanobacter hydrolyticus TaxID=2250595 RepID=A0ABW8J1J7_9GAMM|nr:membrane protein insertase YidC [Rhodanobacter sp. 7MK24]MBD8880884.1 membrane protein insertase YidC [Rhodanobacter sp. 7MK24]